IGSKTGKHKVKTLKGKEKRAYLAVPESERLTSSDLEQGTVTVSNIGSLYKSQTGEMTLLEIVPPQVCAFGVGALKEVPCVVKLENGKKEVGIKTVLPICIAFDHRALDFGDVIPFIKKLDGISASPELVICTNSEKEKSACA
ncbi:MAG: 2-oxo acid dehydrogenase subunit E2, partial [Oscillospiraceae bacterium]|nr:2-oxo acid dehydrogenase subunit E2 [Oscillospiraceae bacterium]